MKMSDFEVGKQYRNPSMSPGWWIRLERDGMYWAYDESGALVKLPLCHDAITRDDWALADPSDPCDDAWQKASSGRTFPCCHDEQCAFSLEKAKEWFIIGWHARQDHALGNGK